MFITRLWKVLEEDWRLMSWSVIFGLFFTGLGIIPPLLIREMIRRLQRPEVVGEFLMSIGYLPGAHREDCPTYAKIAGLRPPWMD